MFSSGATTEQRLHILLILDGSYSMHAATSLATNHGLVSRMTMRTLQSIPSNYWTSFCTRIGAWRCPQDWWRSRSRHDDAHRMFERCISMTRPDHKTITGWWWSTIDTTMISFTMISGWIRSRFDPTIRRSQDDSVSTIDQTIRHSSQDWWRSRSRHDHKTGWCSQDDDAYAHVTTKT